MMMTVSTFLKKNPSLSVTRLLEEDDWPKYEEGDPAPYTEEEIAKFLSKATAEESLIIRFFLGTGCRNGEVMHAEKSDVDFKRGTVWIHPKTLTVKGKRGMRTLRWKPKTQPAGTRHIPISDGLLKELVARPDGLLFLGPNGGLHHKYQPMLCAIAEKAGIDPDDVTVHRLRDTFATAQVRLCKDMQELMTLAMRLGHNDLETLNRYVAYVDAESKQARAAANHMDSYGKLGPVAVAKTA